VDFAAATVATQYGSTARAISASGPPVVVWAATAWSTVAAPGVGLLLNVVVGGSGAITAGAKIQYVIEFSPMYDAGV